MISCVVRLAQENKSVSYYLYQLRPELTVLPVIYTDTCQITSCLNYSQPRCVIHQLISSCGTARRSSVA